MAEIKRYANGVLVAHFIDGISQPIIDAGKLTQKSHVHAIQPEPWPAVLLPLKLLAKPLDRGAGDTIARVIGPIGGDAFKKWYKRMFGKPCGCGQRQDALNKRWPL